MSEGARHWRVQRLTAIALAVLGPWLVISLALLPDLGYDTLRGWASGPFHAGLLALLALSLAWHSLLGVQVVIEDYVRGWPGRASLVASALAHVLLVAVALLAIVRIALGAGAG